MDPQQTQPATNAWHWRWTRTWSWRQRLRLLVGGIAWVALNRVVLGSPGDFIHWLLQFPGVIAIAFAALPESDF